MRAFWFLYKRELLRFVRQRSRLIGAVLTPLLFWFLVGGGLGQSFQNPSAQLTGRQEGYFEFFFPGILALSVLFTAIFSTISVIEDRHQGFLQGVLVSPVSRLSIVLSKVLSGATLGMFQGSILCVVAWVAGLRWDWLPFLEATVLLFAMGAGLTALSFVFAWKLDSVQGYHSIMNLVLMPMWILSGAVFPVEGGASFFRWVAWLNPLSYSMQPLRELLSVGDSHGFVRGLVVMLLLLTASLALSTRMMGSRRA